MSIINHKRVPIQLHNAVMQCLRQHLSSASLFFNTTFIEPEIIYRKKGSIAGSAFLERWQIQLNINMLLDLYLKDNKNSFIAEVIPHELAHLITYKKFGRVSPHGKEWKYVMENVLHCKAKRTHSFELPLILKQNRHTYRCQCQEHLLTNIRHKKIQQKQIQYYCKNCGDLLQISENHST